MSYEHGTTHYNLPQTVGSDTRDWFDTNEAFADIDAAIYSAGQTAEQSVQDLTEVKADVQGLKDADIAMTNRVDGIESRTGASEQAIGRLEQEVADVDTDLMDSICAIKEASATAAYQHLTGTFFWYNDTLYKATADIGVGNQIVPDTNCKTTNITTELLEGGSSDLEPRVAQLETDMGTLMFRVDGGNAQYSKDGGTTWSNFKNPVGTRSITANGTYDVTDYASANVNVPGDLIVLGSATSTSDAALSYNITKAGKCFISLGMSAPSSAGATVSVSGDALSGEVTEVIGPSVTIAANVYAGRTNYYTFDVIPGTLNIAIGRNGVSGLYYGICVTD